MTLSQALIKLVGRKFAGLIFGGLILVGMQLLKANVTVMGPLAMGFAAAFTALIAGQSVIDHTEAKKAP